MNWSQQACLAIATFILAALLGPEIFGTVAMAVVYVLFIQMVLEQGFVAAIIQREKLLPEHLDAVFWLICGSSLALVGLSVAFSGWWAEINELPALAPVICVLSLSIPLTGLGKVQEALLQRSMDFKSLAIRTSVSTIASASLAVLMALAGFGIWAFVAQILCRDAISTSLLWRFSPWRPRLRWAARAARALLGFSTGNFTATLGIFASMQVDTLLVGLFFGPLAAGLYRIAERIMMLAVEVTSRSLAVVSFPEFSRVQADPVELRQKILSFLRISSIVTIPLMATLAVMSDLLMELIGPEWAAASTVLKVMCMMGVIFALVQFTGPILQATARPFLYALLIWSQGILNIVILILLGFYLTDFRTSSQILGIALAKVGLSAAFWIPISATVLFRSYGVPLRGLLRAVGPSVCAALGAILAGGAASSLLTSMSVLPTIGALALGSLISLSIASIILVMLDPMLYHEISRLLRVSFKLPHPRTEP